MQVKRCSSSPKIDSKPTSLSWEEMKKNEGVYQSLSSRERYVYFIVIAGVVLWYNSHTDYLVLPGEGWHSQTFVKVDKEVCFEVRDVK